jgi:L-iditol 2-dehydrogenase
MPASSCFRISDHITLDQAALSEPLAIGVYATRLSGSLRDKSIGILGSGPIGISVLLPAILDGAQETYMTDIIDARLAVASEMGVEAGAQPLNRTARKAKASRADLVDPLMKPPP